MNRADTNLQSASTSTLCKEYQPSFGDFGDFGEITLKIVFKIEIRFEKTFEYSDLTSVL